MSKFRGLLSRFRGKDEVWFYDKFSPDDAPVPSYSSTPTPTITPTNTPTPSLTPGASPSQTPSHTPTPTPTPSGIPDPDDYYTYDIFLPTSTYIYGSPGMTVTGGLVNIDWGDGNVSLNQSITKTTSISHTYTSNNQSYRIKLYPPSGQTITYINHSYGNEEMVTALINWGDNVCNFTDSSAGNGLTNHFSSCINLTSVPTSLCNLTGDTVATQMFSNCTSFNSSNITGWTTTNLIWLQAMFGNCISFNQNIGGGDVSNVQDFASMFFGASSFDQALGNWDLSSVNVIFTSDLANMLDYCNMSTGNYDTTLVGWAAQAPPSGITLGAQGLTYSLGSAAETARNTLITTYGWTINGDSGV